MAGFAAPRGAISLRQLQKRSLKTRFTTRAALLVFAAWSLLCLVWTSTAIAANGARKVFVSFAIVNISNIDCVANTFEADFYVRLRWHEPSLIGQSTGVLNTPPEFRPRLDFSNAKSLNREREEENYHLVGPGNIQTENRFRGVFTAVMDLHRFPFDSQHLTIGIEDFDRGSDEMLLVYESDGTYIPPGERRELREASNVMRLDDVIVDKSTLAMSDWSIQKIIVQRSEQVYAFFDHARFSRFTIDMTMQRLPLYYLTKIVLVLVILVVASWVALFFSPEDLGNRSTICITSLLAVIAHNYVSTTILPRIAYLSTLDCLLFGGMAMVFLSGVESLVVAAIVRAFPGDQGHLRACQIDRQCRWAFPAGFALFYAFVAFYG
jgi:hypothetical protein